MALQSSPLSRPKVKRQPPSSVGQVIFAVAFVALATIFLIAIDRSNLLFPVWSALAFPMLAISPFVIFALQIPTRLKALLVLLVALVVVPFLGLEDTFYLELAIQIGIFAVMALGLNIVVGFAGLLDLGYIAFFAVGAYLWGIFSARQADTIVKLNNGLVQPEAFWLFLFGGFALAAIAGILLGLPVLRLRGDYLAIVTLGFGEMIRVLVSNLSNVSSNPDIKINITNGAQGLPGIASPPLPQFFIDTVAAVAQVLGLRVTNLNALAYQVFFYLLVMLLGVLAVIIAARLDNSPIGRAWTAIREDETAAIAMGVPLVKMKLLAFAMGAAFAGVMGVIYAAKQTFVSPESFSFNQSIFILAIVIVGGMGSIRGVILGAIAVTLLNIQTLPNLSLLINSFKNSSEVSEGIRDFVRNWPPQLEPAKYQRFVFGILLILMMIFRPAGILPASRRKMEIEERMETEAPGAQGVEEPVIAQAGETSHAP
jgi:branched-chain amino acid transport system permease protein